MDLFQDDIPNLDGTVIICGISAPDHRLSLFFDSIAASVLGDRVDLNLAKSGSRIMVISRGASLRLEHIGGEVEAARGEDWKPVRRIKVLLHRLPISVPLPFHMVQVQAIIRNGKVHMNLPSMVEI